MRVLLCTAAFDNAYTGGARVARVIAQMSTSRPYVEVHVLSEDVQPGPGRYHCKITQAAQLPALGYHFKSRDYARAISYLNHGEQYDIIFFNDLWLAHGTMVYFKKSEINVPVVSYLHDDSSTELSKRFAWKFSWGVYMLRARLERSAAPNLSMLFVNSEYLRKQIMREFGLAADQIATVHYLTMDYKHIEFRFHRIDPSKQIKVLFAKHDYQRGGLHDLVKALAILSQYRFQLTVVGPVVAHVQRALRQYKSTVANISTVVLPHVNTDHEMLALYYSHDLFCVPARREALGLANAEAIVCGTPVVATNVGGIPEVLGNGKYGYLSTPGSPASLAEAIRRCICDTQTTKQKVLAGRDFIVEKFKIDGMYQDLYRSFQAVVAKTLNKA